MDVEQESAETSEAPDDEMARSERAMRRYEEAKLKAKGKRGSQGVRVRVLLWIAAILPLAALSLLLYSHGGSDLVPGLLNADYSVILVAILSGWLILLGVCVGLRGLKWALLTMPLPREEQLLGPGRHEMSAQALRRQSAGYILAGLALILIGAAGIVKVLAGAVQ